jgi:molybdopterin converting factor small subunit
MPDDRVTVRLFGSLHTFARERGWQTTLDAPVPTDGLTARDLARSLDLPLEKIEGVFCNRSVHPLDWVVRPGDRVAFVPKGTPGPHRVFLGLYAAGKEGRAEDA